MIDIVFIILGIGFLYLGGEGVLSGVLSVSMRLGMSKVLASVILIGFGTSAPEVFVSFNSILQNSPDIAIGNIMGSNIANVLLIGGLGLGLAPIIYKIQNIGYELIFFGISACIPLIAMLFFGGMVFKLSIICIGMLCIYFYLALKRPHTTDSDENFTEMPIFKSIIYTIGGLVLLVVGADVLISGAINIATKLGVSQAIIGVSMVALGTSLPEIATTISAARRHQGDMIIGNVLGSNLFNTLLVLGGVGLYQAIPIHPTEFMLEAVLIPIISIALIFIIQQQHLTRTVGIFALLTYGVYIASWVV